MVDDAKEVLSPPDFLTCAIWRYDEDDDLYHPVLTPEQLPESERNLSIRATFMTPSGKFIPGYIVGIEKTFSFGLFDGNRVFHVNINLPTLSAKQLISFLQTQTGKTVGTFESLFPLSYKSTINKEPFVDFRGRFENLPPEE